MINEIMKRLSELPNVTLSDGQEYIQLYDAMETVKRALEQSSGDLINRQDAIKAIDEKAKRIKNEDTLNGLAGAVGILFDLPSVTQKSETVTEFADRCRECGAKYGKLLKPKTGHWILADEQNKEDVENDNYRFICSECQCSDIHAKGTIVPYCWKCGRRMVEPQESEKINCKATKCENCKNHNYCDYEPQERSEE